MSSEADPQQSVPDFDADRASQIAAERYRVEGTMTPLPSDRDQNFLVRTNGRALVLRIANALEDPGFLAARVEALRRLADAEMPYRTPIPLADPEGRALTEVASPDGTRHHVWMTEWIPGRVLAEVRPHTPELLEEVGEMMGAVDRALTGWAHPATERYLRWDLRQGLDVVEEHLDAMADETRRERVRRTAAGVREALEPLTPRLRTGVVHGDGNDWNVLVSEPARPLDGLHVAGLLDFGDMVRSWVVAEPAVAAAYAMLGKRDPVAAVARVVAGYNGVFPLEEPEVDALWHLVRLRLCVSQVMSATQRRERPEVDYLGVSEEAVAEMLERLEDVHPRLAVYTLRDACGLEPCPDSARVAAWLGRHRNRVDPVLDVDVDSALVLDLGQRSPLLLELAGRTDAEAWGEAIFGRMREAGADVGVGLYGEVRPWYTGPAYRVETDRGDEWRTVHLGVDLFVPPDTPVLAPLAGTVASLADNDRPLDYGPTVVLRHEVDGDDGGDGEPVVFHTLYGHLRRRSLDALEVGEGVEAGERIGWIGDATENGGWAPHLHLQLVVDPLDRIRDFPGVARPSREAVWRSLSPDPEAFSRTGGLEPDDRAEPVDSLLRRRAERLGPNLSISYHRPLHIVRGWRQHLYDAEGQPYLDCVNNVAHVGHGHPRVVRALSEQAAVLNTNTRYLHEALLRYAERLTATLPEPLSVCWFVCSGSEANELALRLARTHTGRTDVVVLEGAYHGSTGQLVGMSPYKFDAPGGTGRPDHVHVADLPDPYRGRFRAGQYDPEEIAEGYASSVDDALTRARGRGGAAAFFAESLPSCAGQIVLPDGYLERVYRSVREAGAVSVADEVQVGFGRVGSHFWGFRTQGVVPDIVTMGKPIGNGHPVAAVVTTPEIARSFDTGMEYFNTFGGNPVSCAVGMAVLDALEEEGLQEHALRVGDRLKKGLEELEERHPLVGDVRGRGLFVGVELVKDPETRTPAGEHAAYLVERMRDHRILLSTDGPDHNVLKLKPPLVFDEADAARVVETLDRVLEFTPARLAGNPT